MFWQGNITLKSAGHHPNPQGSQVSVEGDAAGDPEAPSTYDNNTPTSSTRPSQHTTDSATTREKELLDKLAEVEERHRALLARSQDLPVPVMMVRNVHTIMAGALGDLGTNLATYYVAEMVKFMTAIVAHVKSGGPLPRFTLEPPASHSHTTPVAVPSHYETIQLPPAHVKTT